MKRFAPTQTIQEITPSAEVPQLSATEQPIISTTKIQQNSPYTDGKYTGTVSDAVYGNVQIQIAIVNGEITNIEFLQYPNDQETSRGINQQANPLLAQETIQAQSAAVDIISGATLTSQAYIQSLQSALKQARH